MITVDVGNPTSNVIPAQAKASFNIRFTPLHTAGSLQKWIENVIEAYPEAQISFSTPSEAFLTQPGTFCEKVTVAVQEVTGIQPMLSTTGGTSDARFISDYAPVVEFGLIHQTAHQVDEHVAVRDIEMLRDVYVRILELFFGVQ